ncbi:hypothetical protein [Halorussus marinus]|uniref:hypothetical protein n=1 Tax=Halorussus marinus TaxID=2505976 RepID=UPI001091B11E|nr:hypothetical protein [Halorussus marinus]
MGDPDIDELREQSRPGDRASNTNNEPSLEDRFIDALDAVEDGGSNMKTLSARDKDLAAFVRGLEADESELEAVVEQLHEVRGRGNDVNRQELIISAVWIGLQEACPEAVEAFKDAKGERARQL